MVFRKKVKNKKKGVDVEIIEEAGYDSPPRGTLFYGMEIEVEVPDARGDAITAIRSGTQEYDGSMFYFKSDGSLDNGFEIVTQPCDYAWWMTDGVQFIDKVTDAVRSEGGHAYRGGRCGLHIHATKQGLTRIQMFKMARFIFDSRNRDKIVALSRREGFDRMRDYSSLALRSHRFRANGRNRNFTQSSLSFGLDVARNMEGGDRNAALNFVNPQTVELRMFRGTLNGAYIIAAVQFYNSVIEYCSLNAGFSMRGIADWTQYKKYLTSTRRYGKLLKYFEEVSV
jgi:hypothetical protein